LLGLEFDRVTVETAADELERHVHHRSPARITCVNVALYVWARSAPWLWQWYRGCDLLIADGMGIFYASRLLGEPTPGITNAVLLMYELLKRASVGGYRVYLLGTRADYLELAVSRIQERYPGVDIVGYRDGFFSLEEEPSVVQEIVALRPDILLIGISSVRKEQFLQRNLDALGVPVCLGVGGALDVVAGVHRLAPHWIRVAGLEWAFRLMQEPRRLWRRYLTTNTTFAYLVLVALVRRVLRPLTGRLRVSD
jgi:N-acetylglucosaminyldiphosphoundecaprenol N-acetyl-beta-D-mannosaminyltransferase